jgi:type I restriction-modification system DNA methylase subunit
MNQTNLSSFIWSVADLLRGDYKQSDYGNVILPFTVLRRLDCVLEATKEAVLKEKDKREKAGLNPEPFLLKKSGQLFYNTSPPELRHRKTEVIFIAIDDTSADNSKSVSGPLVAEVNKASLTELFGSIGAVSR